MTLADLGIERVGGAMHTIYAKSTILGAEYPVAKITAKGEPFALHGYICDAVNAHDLLVEACKAASVSCHHPHCKQRGEYAASPEKCTCHVGQAKNALAQLEGK